MANPRLIEEEADRVEDAYRKNPSDGVAVLNEILRRSSRLTGVEKTDALAFASLLVTRLRERDERRHRSSRLRIWET